MNSNQLGILKDYVTYRSLPHISYCEDWPLKQNKFNPLLQKTATCIINTAGY